MNMVSRYTGQSLFALIFPLARRGISTPHKFMSSITKDESKVVVAEDGKTLVCWHPEPEFPYEHTLPLPESKVVQKNVIKALDEVDKFKGTKEEFVRNELMKTTFTTKHRWFPRLQKRKAKKTPMDRPYL